jgi:hypothetical protein
MYIQKVIKQKNGKKYFFCILKANNEKAGSGAGFGSVN